MLFVTLVAACIIAATVGSLAGWYAASREHRALRLDVNDALERTAYLYDRIRKRTRVDGEDRDHPAMTELTKTELVRRARQQGLLMLGGR